MAMGRNDPCPCGSGKKYKKCHGVGAGEAATRPEVARANALKRRDTELGEQLIRYARMRYGPYWLHDVLEAEDLLDEGELAAVEMPIVIPWLFHFRVDANGVTPAREWSRQERRRISPDDALLLEAYERAWLSIWEVTEVIPGLGSQLTDLLTREERFVHDVRSSATLERFDAILAIVLSCDGVSFFGGLHGQPLSPRFAERVLRAARQEWQVGTHPVSLEKLRDAQTQLDLMEMWNEAADDMLNQPPPVLQNTDGDPLLLTRDDFAVVGPPEDLTQRLASLPGVGEPEEEGDATVFVVCKAGNALHRSWDNTMIGRIVLSGTRLSLETNSTRRADALRSAVETHLPGLLRFRLRKEENTDQLVAAARASASTRSGRAFPALPPEAVAALRQFREQHMREWLDENIPALDGLTPREAARSPRRRPKLELLLKELEQSEARQPEQQRLDLRWVREELGFL